MAMKDDYLWNREGSDAEIESLERLLAPAALGAPRSMRRPRAIAWLAGVAAAAIFAVGALQALRPPAAPPALDESWVSREDGLRRLDLGRYGHVDAEPGARVRVLRRDDELQSLRLDAGTIHASITREARPRLFQVETPAATCIDLGCQYTLTVDRKGMAEVRVSTGRVAFNDGKREVFIPEGASGRSKAGRVPYTPIYDTATDALKKAVEAFDEAPVGRRTEQAKALSKFVRTREDGLVVWHLLQDPEAGVVKAAMDALLKLTTAMECGVPRPTDPTSLRAWRDSLFPEWKTWDVTEEADLKK
jgi:hypothetical protein